MIAKLDAAPLGLQTTAMTGKPAPNEYTGLQQAGFFVFVIFCGVPALELNGFGMGIPLSLQTALLSATVGGAVGGMLICPRPLLAGLAGGLLAGPLGLVAVYYYTQQRQAVWHVELVLVQGIACLPGLGVGWLIKYAWSNLFPEPHP